MKGVDMFADGSALVEHFQNVLKIIDDNQTLRSATQTAKEMTYVISENHISNTDKRYKDKVNIQVMESTTFNAAKKYAKKNKVAVLNFANPVVPGGGVLRGAMAQEECLCRSSNLYACLNQQQTKKEYYDYNRSLGTTFCSDRVIASLGVTVFMSDDVLPQELPRADWFTVDVLSCAAPYISRCTYANRKVLKQLFKRRIKNIFEVALSFQAEVMILGAFGCGAFKNPPETVAKAFREVIVENGYDYKFKEIIFAIKRSDTPCPNLIAFESQFNVLSAENNMLRFSDGYALGQGIGAIRLPSGKILRGKDECEPYHAWQRTNKYYGKQFSILGDSISTLIGYNPSNYSIFYDDENCKRANIDSMKDAWWGKLIDFYGGELLVNNSWSGSRVTKLPQSDRLFPSGCSPERTSGLQMEGVTPDVIVIYLGINDWANGVAVSSGCYKPNLSSECFDQAYGLMVKNLKHNYPQAEIWCCTLNVTCISHCASFAFPHAYGGIHIEEYNKIIAMIAEENYCKLLDLYKYRMPNDTIDGVHPNENGMAMIATLMIRETADANGISFIN